MKHDLDFMDPINRDLKARRIARKLLEVSEGANEEELKRAFRRAAVACHPDHVGNTEDANRRFALIKCAYELLANDKPCEELLEETISWTDVPEDESYRLENPWGHFLWWRDRFFSPPSRKESQRPKSCI
jgi:curved DNA-binding protein CbpA